MGSTLWVKKENPWWGGRCEEPTEKLSSCGLCHLPAGPPGCTITPIGTTPPFVDEPDVAPEVSPAARPRSLAAVSVFTGLMAMFDLLRAKVELDLATSSTSPVARDFESTFALAMWEATHARPSLVVASEIACLLVSVLLFVASSRVLVRARGSGWLWRQALAGNFAVFVSRAVIARALAPTRVEAFDRVAASVGEAARAGARMPDQMTPQQFARVATSLSIWLNLGAALLMAALLVYAARPMVREATS